jgi:hypothetical protein
VGGRLSRIRVVLALVIVAGGLVAVGSGASGLHTQNGPDNYAGPRTCADASAAFGVAFDDCTNETNVTQASNGGVNVFEAPLAGTGGTAVQTNTTGPNKFLCVVSATNDEANGPATDQQCNYTQTGDGGNAVVADMQASHSFSDFAGLAALSQDAIMSLKGSQNSSTGNNTVSGPGGGAALLKTTQSLNSQVSGSLPPNQRQERLILLDADQVASSSGNNSIDFNLDSFQSAIAQGISPDQGQDIRANGASDPNNKAYVYQRTATGTNTTKGRGLDSKLEESRSILGSATQKQWHTTGGFDIVADVDSSGNPGGGTVDFGTPYAEGTDCAAVDGFRKIGVIRTFDAFNNPTTAGTRAQDDGLPIGIPGLSPKTVTAATCSKLDAPAGTSQRALLTVDGHAKDAITGAMSAKTRAASAYKSFDDQTVHESIDCTATSCSTAAGGVTGSGTDVTATAGTPFTGQVATFKNNNPSEPVASATINWGDGTDASSGTISGSGPYSVSGTHTYANAGSYPINVTLKYGDDSVAATMSSTATVSGPTGSNVPGGAFVIGDKSGQFGNAGVGSNVTFWSQSWSSLNPTTSGTAMSSFKGWENTVTNPACGSPVPTWQSKSGNSPPPPAGALPRYMRVIVASNVGKAGSNPSGNIARIVVIDTQGTAYNPNPASNGTGVVVSVVCTSP